MLAIGEWNWGAEKTVNGALAIADVLGIFGRDADSRINMCSKAKSLVLARNMGGNKAVMPARDPTEEPSHERHCDWVPL